MSAGLLSRSIFCACDVYCFPFNELFGFSGKHLSSRREMNSELLQMPCYFITDVTYCSVAVPLSPQYRTKSDNEAAVRSHVHLLILQAHE